MGYDWEGGAALEATLNGCRIHYELRLNPATDAPTITLLHGWGCDGATFSFIADALSKVATILVPDFPGHGQSDEPPEPWGVEDYAAQVLALLELHHIARTKIIAHSFGGRIAVVLAARHPETVDQLVITGGAGIQKPTTERARKRTASYKRYTAMLNKLRTVPPLRALADRVQTRLRNRYGSPDYIKLDENMRKTFVKVISEDLFPLLKQIQAPTLLVWGSGDTETPLWMGQAMEAEIPDAGLVVFEGGTHFAFLEQWQRFVVIVQQFFLGGQA